jgi:hypothetical protein
MKEAIRTLIQRLERSLSLACQPDASGPRPCRAGDKLPHFSATGPREKYQRRREVQLTIEYDPHPPLDCGDAARAPAALRETIIARARAREAELVDGLQP